MNVDVMEGIYNKRRCYICGRLFSEHVEYVDGQNTYEELDECFKLAVIDFCRYAVGADYPQEGEEGRPNEKTVRFTSD